LFEEDLGVIVAVSPLIAVHVVVAWLAENTSVLVVLNV
jgi:hypothetical protein